MTGENRKIIFIINDLILGGAQKNFVLQANFLHDKGCDVYVATLYNLDRKNYLEELKIPEKNILSLGLKNIKNIFTVFKSLLILRKYNFHIIYSTLDDANFFARFLKLLSPHSKLVIREANVAEHKTWKYTFIDRFFTGMADLIICVATEVRDSLQSYKYGNKDKFVVLENGVIIENLIKKDPNRKSIKILNVGTLNPKKSQLKLIEAFSKIKREDCLLSIVGEGELMSKLRDKINDLGLSQRVFLRGSVDHKQMPSVYQDSDILVSNSLWEGFPNVVLEAMSFGLPVISTRVSGISNIITDGVDGFVIDLGDENALLKFLTYLVDNKEAINRMGMMARRKIEDKFTLDKQLNKFYALIENI